MSPELQSAGPTGGVNSAAAGMPRFLARFPLVLRHAWQGYAAAVALSAVAFWLRYELDGQLPPGFPFLTFFPSIIITSFLFGLRPGVVAATLGLVLSWYFFVSPVHSFALNSGAAVALLFFLFVIAIVVGLIHVMQHALAELSRQREVTRRLADNRELLFRELQHRVGNNLQVVSSLLILQKRKLADPSARAALDEASRRIGLIGRIQRQLYDPDGAQLGVADYLDQIARGVLDAAGQENVVLEIVVPEDRVLAPHQAIPVALVVSEAISNAIEHGLAGQDAGRITISAIAVLDAMTVSIEDDGNGLPEGFVLSSAGSLGLTIAQSLATQLGGSFLVEPRPTGGTRAALELPLAA